MRTIYFTQHSLEQMRDRGASREEVELAIREGESQVAKKGRLSYRKNFAFEKIWKSRYYRSKQVVPIVVKEAKRWVVVTVYVFFIGEKT